MEDKFVFAQANHIVCNSHFSHCYQVVHGLSDAIRFEIQATVLLI